jgi:hypothetical protein
MNFNKGFFTFFTEGNAADYTSIQEGSLGLNLTTFSEISLAHSRRISDRLWIGVNLKMLQGIYNLTTQHFNLEMQGVDFENYIEVSSKAKILLSAPVEFTYDEYQFINDANFYTSNIGTGDILMPQGNPGFAVDFGFVYKITNKIVLSASVVDLGNIQWKKDVRTLNQESTYRYNPADLSNSYSEELKNYVSPSNVFDSVKENFRQSFKIIETDISYSQSLPYQLYLGAKYNLTDKLNIGFVFSQQSFRQFNQQLCSTSINSRLYKKISLSGSFIVEENDIFFGFAGNAIVGPMQLSISANNISGIVNPSNVYSTIVQLGLKLRL